ncbi:TPA: hypothetical protein U1C40_002119, partial [Streptococcus suis]|nr:hypothetical protein [Streptococcus suis]
MSKQMEYRQQISVIEDQLTKENKEYIDKKEFVKLTDIVVCPYCNR